MRYLVLLFVAAFLVLNEPIKPVASPGDQVGSLDVADSAPSMPSTSAISTADVYCAKIVPAALVAEVPLGDLPGPAPTSAKSEHNYLTADVGILGLGEPLRVWDTLVGTETNSEHRPYLAPTADLLPIRIGQEAVGRRRS